MRAYATLRFTEQPDVADIRREGRSSRVGRLDDKGYFRRPKVKREIRRHLKRRDKARRDAWEMGSEN